MSTTTNLPIQTNPPADPSWLADSRSDFIVQCDGCGTPNLIPAEQTQQPHVCGICKQPVASELSHPSLAPLPSAAPAGNPPADSQNLPAAPAFVPADLLGRELNEFSLVRILGRGGMGVVYEAVDRVLGRTVAVKAFVPRARGSLSHDLRVRVLREARATGRLTHPNIVNIYQAGEAGGLHYLVMEFLAGGPLSRRIAREGPLPTHELLLAYIGTSAALATAHAKGLLHRDVKPSNVLISEDGLCKLGDFGLACEIGPDGLGTRGEVVGTPRYASPEVLMGQPASPASDVYSLAVTMYEAASGRPPYAAETRSGYRQLVQTRPVPPVRTAAAHLPASLCEILDRCMDRNPARRPRAAELCTSLRQLRDV
mgnify:CR=1 FL=1